MDMTEKLVILYVNDDIWHTDMNLKIRSVLLDKKTVSLFHIQVNVIYMYI